MSVVLKKMYFKQPLKNVKFLFVILFERLQNYYLCVYNSKELQIRVE